MTTTTTTTTSPAVRRLFLDDDPDRAREFLAVYPDAVWVQTVPECIAKLAETWDEVHLDHDLGGEQNVEAGRDDCGMAVVRWLSFSPRVHLAPTRFVVHSHNGFAASLMTIQMKCMGFKVVAQPFGSGGWRPPPPRRSLWSRIRSQFARRRGSTPPTAETSSDPAPAPLPGGPAG
jgi:hypothetical protein